MSTRPLTLLAFLGLAAAAPAVAQEYHLRHYAVDDGLPSSQVRDVTQDPGGRMWFATRAGVAAYDGRDWRTYSLAQGLSWADQFALRWGADGSLWSVSSIAPFRIFRRDGERWQEVPGPAKVSPQCRITAFAVLGEGAATRLAIGTAADGVLLADGRGSGASGWRQVSRREGLPDDRVADLAVWGERLVIATAGGLAELHQGRVRGLLAGAPVPSPAIAGLALEGAVGDGGPPAEHRDGERLWVVGAGWSVQLAAGGRFTLLADRSAAPGAGGWDGASPLAARPDRQGGLYFAEPGAVFYFHPAYGLERLGRPNGLPTDGASSLWVDREDNLWLAGQRGVTKVMTRRFASYTRRQGLYEDEVTAAFERRRDRVWFGTDNGVALWDGVRLTELSVKDGLAGRETHRAAGLVDSRGDVWIGTERGVTVYSERLPGPRPVPPIVELDYVEASGRRQPLASDLALGYDENDLTFEFRVVSLIDEGRLKIHRRLEGFEPGWQPVAGSLERQVRYTNLPPGEYRLHLKAANARGVWSEPVVSAAIVIARPYWLQPWFYVALVSVAAACFYTAQRHLAQKRCSRRLEAEVADRVAELHASEERYRHIFERSQAVKLLLDAESLSIIDANRAACRFYGHSLADLKRLSLDDLRVREPAAVDLASDSGTHLLAERHLGAGGEVRDVELYSSAAEVQGRPVLYVIVQDVTGRRLAEETMSTEKERLAATLRNIDDGVITTDAAGQILLLNRKAEEITGWAGARAVGRRLEEVLRLHEARPGGLRPAGDLGARLRLVSGEEAAPLPSGVWRVLDPTSGIPGRGDPRPGDPRSAAERRPGVEAFEPIEEAVLVARSGKRKLVELSGSPIRQADKVSGLVLAFRDITERRQIENELARTQKLEALGLLAGAEGETLTGSGRVLVMDDDDEVRSVTAAMVERLGYRAEHVADGAEAIELYRRALGGGEPFDAVIMDLTIPGGMGGQTAIRHLLAIDPEVRAIVASGYSNDPVLASDRAYGFRARIGKPFKTEDLARALRQVLAERPEAGEAAQ